MNTYLDEATILAILRYKSRKGRINKIVKEHQITKKAADFFWYYRWDTSSNYARLRMAELGYHKPWAIPIAGEDV